MLSYFWQYHSLERGCPLFLDDLKKIRVYGTAVYLFVVLYKMHYGCQWLQLIFGFSAKSDIYICQCPVFVGEHHLALFKSGAI